MPAPLINFFTRSKAEIHRPQCLRLVFTTRWCFLNPHNLETSLEPRAFQFRGGSIPFSFNKASAGPLCRKASSRRAASGRDAAVLIPPEYKV